MDELASLMVTLGVDMTPMERGFDRAMGNAQRRGVRVGDAFAGAVVGSIVGRLPTDLANIVGNLGRGIGNGLLATADAGAEVMGYRRSLVGIAGDAKTAEAALVDLQRVAGKTDYDTSQVVGLGIRLAGKSGDVMQAVGQVRNVLDAAASFNVAMADFDEFQKNLSDIQVKGAGKVERPDLEQFLRRAPLAVTQAARLLGVSNQEAEKKIRSSSGDELTDLIRRIGEANKGAAERAAGSTPQGIARNIQDSIRQGIAPTGEIINRALAPVFQVGLAAVNVAAEINRVTGGMGLLAVGVLGAAAAARFLGPPLIAIVQGAFTLGPSLLTLAASANRAALSLSLIGPGVPGITGPVAGGASVAGKIVPGVLSALKSAVPGLLIAGGSILGAMAGGALEQNQNGFLSGVGTFLKGAGGGAGLGASIGSLIPGIGTAVGAAVGGVIGGGLSLFERFPDMVKNVALGLITPGPLLLGKLGLDLINGKNGTGKGIPDATASAAKTAEATAKTAEATTRAANSLQEMKNEIFGGGERSRRAVSAIEFEYSLYGAVRGIG